MCPAEEKEVFQCLAVGIHLGGGEQGHFQPELVITEKEKRSNLSREPKGYGTAHSDSLL